MDSDIEGQKLKGTTAKLVGNSAYGKFIEDPRKHTQTSIIPPEKIDRRMKRPMYKSHIVLSNKDNNMDLMEVTMNKQRIEDSRPCHIGFAILQLSKLKLLQFVYFMEHFLERDSYRICYVDTDSVCFATTKTDELHQGEQLSDKLRKIFLPIV